MTEIGEEKYDFPKLLFQLSRKLLKTLKSSQAKLEGSSTFTKKFIPIQLIVTILINFSIFSKDSSIINAVRRFIWDD